MLRSDVVRLVASNMPLRDRIISLRLVSRACLREVDSMGTDCLILEGTPSVNRWCGHAIHSANPGCIRQFQPRMLKLQDMAGLRVDEMQRLLQEAQPCLKSLTVCGWNPPKLESFGITKHDVRGIFSAFRFATQIQELSWSNELPLSLTLRVICNFENLVSLRLTLTKHHIQNEVDLLHLHALQVLPSLQEFYLQLDDECWATAFSPLQPLCVALAPLRRLNILDSIFPFYPEAGSVSTFLGMLKQLASLVELRTLSFSTRQLWDQIDHAPCLQKLRLEYSEPRADDLSAMVHAVCGGRLPQLKVLQLDLQHMDHDYGGEIEEENWPDWLLDTFAQLKDSSLQRIEWEEWVRTPLDWFDFEGLQDRLAEGGVELVQI